VRLKHAVIRYKKTIKKHLHLRQWLHMCTIKVSKCRLKLLLRYSDVSSEFHRPSYIISAAVKWHSSLTSKNGIRNTEDMEIKQAGLAVML
jgi:hypothetical protein